MRKKLLVLTGIAASMLLYLSCNKVFPDAPSDDQILDGPIEGLTPDQTRIFLQGDVAFNDEIFTTEKGLGPLFVANSCGSCHAGDGKGHPFTTLTRFGQTDTISNQFLHSGGPQLQNRAIVGFQPEQIPAGATFSKFTPPANTGLGLLEAVSDATLLALSDPNDANGDGISGRPNWISTPQYSLIRTGAAIKNGKYIGRFGKKAAVYDLMQQTVNAYNQDMGINSTYEHYDTYNGHEVNPEVSNQTVLAVIFYLQTLKAPIQRNINDQDVQAGKQLFINNGCASCHTPQMQTGHSNIAALSNKTFFPFTDLLLHDMGVGLDDGYTEGTALTSEWRTPPLWGLGLSKNSQGGQYFLMHDGRAKSIEEAILMHGGEGGQSKSNFQNLSQVEKARLIKFLESL
ncbi:c-type cytochrome [Chitinophagaceae bacterium LB-8]|uniref:C-type cytochrome n=1 Tax=Paraflavisolibacter caeni TaxID=2982496 RepID=A0A9X2XW58_9BACT|nr:di-heme oxidoredictase family protein [Paraflavisolibacter caeni]MCU7550504.1 c-type cytochrome [Paraflavisolibacter caeni]